MTDPANKPWETKQVLPETVLSKIRPGMGIFLGTGVAEPRTLVKALLSSNAGNLRDLEFIQLVSFGEAVSIPGEDVNKFRLKTFFEGWVASEAITAGRVDLVIADATVLQGGFLDTDAGQGYAFIGPSFTAEKWFGEGIGIAVRKGDDDLKAMFNQAIQEIRANGVYQEINAKYFDFDLYGE